MSRVAPAALATDRGKGSETQLLTQWFGQAEGDVSWSVGAVGP